MKESVWFTYDQKFINMMNFLKKETGKNTDYELIIYLLNKEYKLLKK